jgi:hypothetical protein
MALQPVYTTGRGTVVGVVPGTKSQYDFRVKYRQPGRAERTPKHIHIIIDLYMKLVGNEHLTVAMVDHLLGTVLPQLKPVVSYPPALQVFQPSHALRFQALNGHGEYEVDFLLPTIELIQIQEKTNYPTGTMNVRLFRLFQQRADIFSVVSAATFR